MDMSEVSFRELTREVLALLGGEAGTVTWANAAWAATLGLAADAVIGTTWPELLVPEAREGAREALAAVRREGAPVRDRRLEAVGPGGSRRWVSWSLAPAGGGGVALSGCDVHHEVVTEARRAELERERNVFIGGPVVVFRWRATEGWPVEYVSPNVAQLGVTADDLMSGRVTYGSIVHPDDLRRVKGEVQRHSEQGTQTFEQEYRLVRQDGKVVWIYDFTVVIRDGSGAVTHYEGYIVDVSDHKRDEEELRQRMELIEQQREAIQSLSSPVIEVWEGVLALPVVGLVDSKRAGSMTDALLAGIEARRPRHAIIDLTGVELVDTSTAAHLLRMVQAAKLLGVECALSGIAPVVAQTLVGLSVDFGGLLTFSRLRDALRHALRAQAAARAGAPRSPAR